MTEDVGRSFAAVTQFALPLLAVSLLFVAPPLPAGVGAWLLFLPSCALSFLLRRGVPCGRPAFAIGDIFMLSDWQGIELAPSEVREYPLEKRGGEQVTP